MAHGFAAEALKALARNLACRRHRPPCIYLTPATLLRELRHRLAHGKWLPSGVIAARRGKLLLLGPGDSVMDLCLLEEPCTESLVHRLVEEGQASKILNIGAFIGSYTVPLAHRGAEVVAVEPNPLAQVFLEKNIEINGVASRTRVLGAAVCEKPTAQLCISTYHMGASTLTSHEECTLKITVPCITSLEDHDADLAIVDVEGYEPYVITALPRPDHMVVEVRATTIQRVHRIARDMGYKCRIIEQLAGTRDIYNMHCWRATRPLSTA